MIDQISPGDLVWYDTGWHGEWHEGTFICYAPNACIDVSAKRDRSTVIHVGRGHVRKRVLSTPAGEAKS